MRKADIFDKEERINILVEKVNERNMMHDILVLLGIVAVWVVLQAYILPKMGIPT